jgi:hypothetical protein
MARCAGLATIKFRLYVGFGKQQARRASIDHATYCRAMRFSKSGNAKKLAYRIAGHDEISEIEIARSR